MKVAWQRFLARIKWKQKKNIVFKYNFSIIKPKPNKALIFDLNDEDANVVFRKEEFEIVCCNFYIKLCQFTQEIREQTKLKIRILELIPKKLISDMNPKLLKVISLENLIFATKSMAKNKSLGLDEVMVDCYIL